MAKIVKAEYIWLDGGAPTQELRSKTKIIPLSTDTQVELRDFPEWGYDGSSTYQAEGGDSDLSLRPVNFVHDPLRGSGSYLVMCEVLTADGTPHESNVRAELRRVLDAGAQAEQAWFGFEQEYTFFAEQNPLGFPEGGYPAPQGPYYCGIGADNAFGREIVEEHIDACTEAGLMIFGVNAEVMPGQWEFQMGYRGDKSEDSTSLNVCDHLWFARWMLHRIAEERGVKVSLDCKPARGDWNGAGMHTNFSTRDMRDPSKGAGVIENALSALGKKHEEHIEVYGHGLKDRLTGEHETCTISQFRHGVADRGASIRIPRHVAKVGHGYLEDRRPGANADPYAVAHRILKTICHID